MTSRTEGGLTYTQTFDTQNRLTSVVVSGQTTQFLYDPDGNLAKKINPDNSKTLYVGGIYEVDKNSGGSVTGTKTYYPVGGAMRVGSTLYYVLKDHLGSASVVTDASGNTVGEDRFYPFGETRFTTGTMYTDKLFTGQREITGLGVYYYGARFYSPKLGRFLSADTVMPGYANPQNLNRFSYTLNNPLRYTDPTGHRICEDYGAGGTCLSEQQATKKYKDDLRRRREEARRRKEAKEADSGGGGTLIPTSTPTPSTTPVPQPVQTPGPSDIPEYTTSSTDWVVSDYYYEYGDWSSEPYGFPMEIGINAGGVGQFSFSIGGHEISLPVLKITEEQRTVGAFRDYEQVQTTVTYSQTGNVLNIDQVTLKKTTINEAIFFQQKVYVFGLYIGTSTGKPLFGDAPPPP